MRKPHSTSILKNLPTEKQREIYEYLRTHSQRETLAWLASEGIAAHKTGLSKFWAWYPLAAPLQAACRMGDTVKQLLEEMPELNLDAQQLSKAGQAIFEAQALEAQNPALFVSLRKMRQADRALEFKEESGRTAARQRDAQIKQKDQDLALAERRVKVLEAKAEQALETVEDSTLTDEQKAARLREILRR